MELISSLLQISIHLLSVLLVLSARFVKSEDELSGLISVQLDDVKISVLVHEPFQVNKVLLDIQVDSQVTRHVAGNTEAVMVVVF
jgi:hypothetical protein